MYTVYAKQDGAKALYTLATAPTFGEARKAAQPFRDTRPTGWRAGVGVMHFVDVVAPTAEEADVLAVWQDRVARGEVNPPIWTGSTYCSDDNDQEDEDEE
jgi:hypothetical protein